MKLFRLAILAPLVLPVLLAGAACSSGAATLAPVAAPVDAAKPASGDAFSSGGTANGPSATSAPGAPDQQLIVYSGTLDLQVDDLRASIDNADQLVNGLGGHVAASDTTTKGDQQYASVTYRIPADKWDEALTGLRAVGAKVLNESTKSEDVTGQAVDLDARIANAKASETALQAIMVRAGTIDDVLSVQRELTQVRGDIESMTAERNLLGDRAALATLAVTFETAVTETQSVSGSWDLGNQVDDAIAQLVRVGQGLATLLIWALIVLVPIVVPLLIVLYVAIRLRRRWLRSHGRPDVSGPPLGTPSV